MRTYFRSQLDLAITLRDIIDNYWEEEIKEDDFIEYVNQVYLNNKEKLYKDGDYTSVVKQRLGLKRLELIDKILMNNK